MIADKVVKFCGSSSFLGSFQKIANPKTIKSNNFNIFFAPKRFFAIDQKNILDHTKLEIHKTSNPTKLPPLDTLVFGKVFTDHMLEVDWTSEKGWETPKILPYHKFSLDPSCMVFHYASELFEGMKAYKDSQGRIRLFRPDMNISRLNRSAKRLFLPTINEDAFMVCLKELMKVERDFIPSKKGYSLYVRPTMIGTQPSLGVSPSNNAKFFIICSPVGPYYPTGFKPVKLLASTQYVRAWPGGSGDAKIGGNYAPGILPQVEAFKQGYQQILWLFDDLVTEVGTMNMFVFWINEAGEKELITPPLDGTILPGVTRDSILALARKWNEFKVSEEKFSITRLLKALEEGRVIESFGAGTAAIVSPINGIGYNGKDYAIPLDKDDPNAQIGKLAKRFVDEIMAIQYGEKESEWSVLVDQTNL